MSQRHFNLNLFKNICYINCSNQCFCLTQEECQPFKRLRLTHSPIQEKTYFVFGSGCTVQEVLQALSKLDQHFPSSIISNGEIIFTQLMEQYHTQSDPFVRCKILNLLRRIATVPEIDPQVFVSQFIPLLSRNGEIYDKKY